MAYQIQQIGVTGPQGRIGSGDEYHIDTKFSNTLSMEDVRDRFDTLAGQYKSDGRNIEFSNQGVGGEVYSLDMSPEDRLSLLQRAANAHSQRDGWHSFDYYAPNVGTDRWDKSAEGAPIYVVGGSGLKIEGGSGGGYGNYGAVIGADGQVISKSGHGDTNQSVYGGGAFGTDSGGGGGSPKTSQQEAVERTQNYANMTKAELDAAYDGMRNDPAKAKVEGMKMHKAFFGK